MLQLYSCYYSGKWVYSFFFALHIGAAKTVDSGGEELRGGQGRSQGRLSPEGHEPSPRQARQAPPPRLLSTVVSCSKLYGPDTKEPYIPPYFYSTGYNPILAARGNLLVEL